MTKYDLFLMQLDQKMRPVILKESNDMMAVITAYNTNPRLADAEFAGTLVSIYLLHIAGVPLQTTTLEPCMDELRIALRAIDDLRNRVLQMSDDHQFEGYVGNLNKQGKKYEA